MTRDELRAERQKLKSEAEIQKEIREYLRSTHRPYTVSDATLSLNVRGQRVQRVVSGWPDITAVTDNGRMFCIEVKAHKGRLSREQALRLKQLHSHGVLVCIARSVEDVAATLALGAARQDDLDEITNAIARPIKSGMEGKPFNEHGF